MDAHCIGSIRLEALTLASVFNRWIGAVRVLSAKPSFFRSIQIFELSDIYVFPTFLLFFRPWNESIVQSEFGA